MPIDLTEYDVRDLAQKVGGAQLLPENADYYIELTRAAAVISSLPHVPSMFKMNGAVWQQWINSGDAMRSGPEMGGDEHEGLFVAEVPFFGGGYYCIPSARPDDPFVLEVLLETALHSAQLRSLPFHQEVAAVAAFGLYLSDQCVRRASLSRKTRPDHPANGDIRWPGEANLARQLQQAVTFDLSDVLAELQRRDLGEDGLHHLTFDFGRVSADYRCPLANPTLNQPIGRLGNELIVVAPTNLLSAIREAILNIAESHRVLTLLFDSIEKATQTRIDSWLDEHRWQRDGLRFAASVGESDARVYRFDADKLAFVHLVTDRLIHGCRQVERRHWDMSPQLELVKATAEAIAKEIPQTVSEILHVVLLHGAGRPYVSRLPDLCSENASSVYMTVDELRVLTQLNSDSLAIWQFAKSKQSRHGMVPMLGGGFLDEYARYREHSSFYTSDEGIPDLIFAAGLGRNVRLEAQEKQDPHVVRMPNDSRYCRVFRLQNIPGFPIYTTDPSNDGLIQLLVETLPFPIWVISPRNEANRSENSKLFYHLADVIAFWIWQMTPALNDWSESKSELPSEIVIGVTFTEREARTASEAVREGNGSGIESEVVGNQINMCFDSIFIERSSGKDNSAERQLARQLLVDIAACLHIQISSPKLEEAIETHAPLGLKRRMKSFDQATAIMIDNSGLPRVRQIQAFEMERIRDEVGQIASQEVETTTSLTRVQCHAVHQAIVKHMFVRLEDEISRFDDSELLPLLIAQHEALIAERRRTESIVGTHLSAMGDTDQERQRLQEDFVEIDMASTASRFLIEYVAARPPSGTTTVSTAAYDRILAVASEIVGSGYLSDGFHLEVAAMEIELVPAGRLKFGTSAYATAVQKFQDDLNNAKVYALLASSEKQEVPLHPEENAIDQLIERAATAEFGLSLDDISRVCGGIALGHFASEHGLGSADFDSLVSFVETHTRLRRDSIARLIELLSSNPRDTFLEPPTPYGNEEVYPWRFNRRLSYLRKPLIRRGNQLFWGRRAVIQAVTYLEDLVETGRIKFPKSSAMKELKGKIADYRGKIYNRELARRIEMLPQYRVLVATSEFNGHRMVRSNGDPMGDVDVAVLDVEKRTFFPVEAKSITLAKTPGEVKNELNSLFNVENRDSAVNHHSERIVWLTTHLTDVVHEFGIHADDASEWTIQPIFVLGGNLLSRYLADAPFPVMTEIEFLRFLSERG